MAPELQGVLRVPLVADGAVGRPGVDRLHRRHGHRRGARPQRPAAVALLRHQGRPRRHGVRGRRARHPARGHRSLKERLHPGRIFLVDTAQGRIVDDEEIKRELRGAAPVRRVAAGAPRSTSRTCPAAVPCRAPDHETVLRAAAGFGYTHEDLRILLAPMARERRRADRLDGHRHGARRAVGPAAAALRLLQAALRAGHQSAARRASARSWSRRWRSTIGPEGNLLEPTPESCRQIKIKYPIIDNEQLAKLRHVDQPGLPVDDAADALRPAPTGAAGLDARDGRALPPGERGGRRTGYTILILSDRGVDARARADSEPARDGRRAPSPRPRGHAHACGARRRDGRRARGAPLRAAPRLRRRRRQPVPRVRDARRHDPPGHARRASTHETGGQELHQGAQQGHPQGDVQDGHLDAAELLRRADLRGGRPRPGVRRPLLHAGRRRASAASASTSSREEVRRRHERAFPRPAGRRRRARVGRRVPVAARRRVSPVQPRDGVQAAARDAQRPVRGLQGVHARSSTIRAGTARRCAACSSSSTRRSPSRSTRSSRSRRSSSASPPARCRTARSARRRTRRSRSR